MTQDKHDKEIMLLHTRKIITHAATNKFPYFVRVTHKYTYKHKIKTLLKHLLLIFVKFVVVMPKKGIMTQIKWKRGRERESETFWLMLVVVMVGGAYNST